jgi:cellulose synthase (UDP-forming)
MMLLRRTDRGGEADLGEARLRGLRLEDLPTVDIMIATYNESLEVLERTITGALAIDWPKSRLKVYVLDDGRREWLKRYCEMKGAGYMTRPDNKHAKAGNINAAIARTNGEFFLVLDADFIPQKNFLYRALGFFKDPAVGIVQIPHNFFNHDPMQTNLSMQNVLPDDQRLFFDVIMPGRDGWDCAFCCGSNSITRRSAIEAVGGGLPTGSITEDMLLTLALLRKGYKTRYLNERLAIGLAPESLSAFFVQRARWARGSIQILFLKDGPLGPGLKLHQRLLFLPTSWISQSFSMTVAMATPAILLWTGLMPLANVDTASVLIYQAPAVLGTILTIRLLAPGQYFPVAAMVHGAMQAFRLLPTILVTLVKPHGHAFKVTPKGADATNGANVDRPTIVMVFGLLVATALGLLLNASYNLQVVASSSGDPGRRVLGHREHASAHCGRHCRHHPAQASGRGTLPGS